MIPLQETFDYIYKECSLSQIKELISLIPLHSVEKEIALELENTLNDMEKIRFDLFDDCWIREKWQEEFIYYYSMVN
jgi:hypothetical protein